MNLAQQPFDLAKAGFYYYGCKDQVKCFSCNGGLRNWDPMDEPIWEHARWFPKCAYVRLFMGQNFLDAVKEKYKDMESGFTEEYDGASQYYEITDADRDFNKQVNINGQNINANTIPLDRNITINSYPVVMNNLLNLNNSIDPINSCDSIENKPQKRHRAPSPRTINSRLDLPLVRKLMELGIKRLTIKQIIEKKLANDGDDFNHPLELAKACIQYEESIKNMQETDNELYHLCISNVSNELADDELVSNEILNSFNIKSIGLYKLEGYNLRLVRFEKQDLVHLKKFSDKLSKILKLKSISVRDIFSNDSDTLSAPIDDSENMDVDTTSKESPIKPKSMSSISKNAFNQDIIMDELEKLKTEKRCAVCLDNLKNTVFLPCAHLASCVECSFSFDSCPICRTKVQATLKIYG